MPENPNSWLKALLGSALVITMLWGALGGLTNALVAPTGTGYRKSIQHAIRQVMLGALVAAGAGSIGGAVIGKWLGLPAEIIAAGSVGGAMAYFTGIFGGAIIEVVLTRIRAGRLPGEDKQ